MLNNAIETSASLALLWLTILLVPPGKVYGVDFLLRSKVMVIRNSHVPGDGRPEHVAHVAAGGDEQDTSAHPDPKQKSCHYVRLMLGLTT